MFKIKSKSINIKYKYKILSITYESNLNTGSQNNKINIKQEISN